MAGFGVLSAYFLEVWIYIWYTTFWEEKDHWATNEKLFAKATNADFFSFLILIKVANKEVLYFIAFRISDSPHVPLLLRFPLVFL